MAHAATRMGGDEKRRTKCNFESKCFPKSNLGKRSGGGGVQMGGGRDGTTRGAIAGTPAGVRPCGDCGPVVSLVPRSTTGYRL